MKRDDLVRVATWHAKSADGIADAKVVSVHGDEICVRLLGKRGIPAPQTCYVHVSAVVSVNGVKTVGAQT